MKIYVVSIQHEIKEPFVNTVNDMQTILPFAELMNSVHLYSFQHRVNNARIELAGSLEDYRECMQFAFVAPVLKVQWLNVLKTFSEEAKEHFGLNLIAPIYEGEIQEMDMIYSYSEVDAMRDVL